MREGLRAEPVLELSGGKWHVECSRNNVSRYRMPGFLAPCTLYCEAEGKKNQFGIFHMLNAA